MDTQQSTDAVVSMATGVDCDLAAEASFLRGFETFSMHGHRAKTLTRNGDLTIVMMSFKRGAHIRDHRAEHPTTLITLRGRMRVGLTRSTLEIAAQHMLSLETQTLYDMEAVEDSDVLLIVGR